MKIRVTYSFCDCIEGENEEFEMEVPDDANDSQINDLADAEVMNQMSQPHVYWDRLPLKPPHRCDVVRQERLLDAAASLVEFCECGRWRRVGTHYWIEANHLPRAIQ